MQKVFRHIGQQLEGCGHALGFFFQDDFVTTLENFDFRGIEPELLGQADGLAVAGFEYSGGGHDGLPIMYIRMSIYMFALRLQCVRLLVIPETDIPGEGLPVTVFSFAAVTLRPA